MYSLHLIIRQVLFFFLFNGDIVCVTRAFLENALTFMESIYDDTQSDMFFFLSSQEQNCARSSPQELFWKIQ